MGSRVPWGPQSRILRGRFPAKESSFSSAARGGDVMMFIMAMICEVVECRVVRVAQWSAS